MSQEQSLPCCIVGSPPFASSTNGDTRPYGGIADPSQQGGVFYGVYGASPGQLGSLPAGTLEVSRMPVTPTITRWDGCYSPGWDKEDLVPKAFSHPAKFSKQLIFRIIQHLVRSGYVQKGDTILDPFGGVGLGALPCMAYGLSYIGVELESRFVDLAQQNLTLWRRRYGFTGGTVVQGDSRQLRQVLAGAEAACCVSSPPFLYTDGGNRPCSDPDGHINDALRRRHAATRGGGYGATEGQLGALPPGTPPDALVSSPPYAGAGQVLGTHNGIDYRKLTDGGKASTPARVASGEGYGVTPGQLGNMAIVGSPPYAEAIRPHDEGPGMTGNPQRRAAIAAGSPTERAATTGRNGSDPGGYGRSAGQLGAMPAGVVSSPPYEGIEMYRDRAREANGERERQYGPGTSCANGTPCGIYGTSPEQLGNTTGDTFWSAASQIVSECAALLPVGGIACWVVKDYISKSKRVPFCDQWRQLCESHGLRLIEEIHASLVESCGTQEALFGEAETVEVARKSFFRRLYEKREGAVRIDHESVLIMRKEAH